MFKQICEISLPFRKSFFSELQIKVLFHLDVKLMQNLNGSFVLLIFPVSHIILDFTDSVPRVFEPVPLYMFPGSWSLD